MYIRYMYIYILITYLKFTIEFFTDDRKQREWIFLGLLYTRIIIFTKTTNKTKHTSGDY